MSDWAEKEAREWRLAEAMQQAHDSEWWDVWRKWDVWRNVDQFDRDLAALLRRVREEAAKQARQLDVASELAAAIRKGEHGNQQ